MGIPGIHFADECHIVANQRDRPTTAWSKLPYAACDSWMNRSPFHIEGLNLPAMIWPLLVRKQARFYAVRKGRCSDFSGTHFSRSGRLVA